MELGAHAGSHSRYDSTRDHTYEDVEEEEIHVVNGGRSYHNDNTEYHQHVTSDRSATYYDPHSYHDDDHQGVHTVGGGGHDDYHHGDYSVQYE